MPDELVEHRDEPVALEDGDELRGAHARSAGAAPARERLTADDEACADVHLRLDIEGDLALAERVLEAGQKLVLVRLLLEGGGPEEPDSVLVAVLGGLLGKERLRVHVDGDLLPVEQGIDTHGGKETDRGVVALHCRRHAPQDLFEQVLVHVDELAEVVLAPVAAHALSSGFDVLQDAGDLPDEHLACVGPVSFVEDGEVARVQRDDAPLHAAVVPAQAPRPFRRQSPIRLSMPVTFSMPVAGSTHYEALRLVRDPTKSAGRLSSPVRRNPRLLQTT